MAYKNQNYMTNRKIKELVDKNQKTQTNEENNNPQPDTPNNEQPIENNNSPTNNNPSEDDNNSSEEPIENNNPSEDDNNSSEEPSFEAITPPPMIEEEED